MNRTVLVGLDLLAGALYTVAAGLRVATELTERAATSTHYALERAHASKEYR